MRGAALWWLMRRFGGGQGGWLGLGVGLGLLRTLALLAVAGWIARAMRPMAGGLAMGAVLAVVGLSVAAGLGYGARAMVLRGVKPMVARLRLALVARALAMDPVAHGAHGAAQWRQTIVAQAEAIDIMANALLGVMLPAGMLGGAALAGLIVLVPGLALPLAAGAAGLVLLRRALLRGIHAHLAAARDDVAGLDADMGALMARHELVQSHAAAGFEQAVAAQAVARVQAVTARASRRHVLLAEVDGWLIGVMLVAGLAGLGWVARGADWAVYAPALFLLFVLRGAVQSISQSARDMADGWGVLGVVRGLLADAPGVASGTHRPTSWRIEARGLMHGWAGRMVLCDVHLTLTPGQVVAITGANGAGKTTLLRLLLGLIAPDGGEVRVDGRPLAQVDMDAYRRGIGVLPQAPVLFAGTLRDMIAYARPQISDEAVRAVMRRVGLDMPPERVLTAEGRPLSGGERQRVALARALVGRPKVLILDEPTNHLDAEGMAMLARVLDQARQHAAVLVISHDRAVVDLADREMVLRDGRLAPVGAAVRALA
ncbi:ATP-binding cassette domain-containing protein [Novosphingobium sp. FSY-8]|uniref:ATP-binding cassette domain-containing protein n=1 Tax=Novosphingobium ovatum TaxID=1908523 RepID=A0ABW9XH89_9SPHN|nr:ATP-binding cassette domain-containing protein [Novosphingobium ovatum]NBC37919.1 ATP-binding cassette domain-containing protein [Novosphingobium ovatum]